MTDEKRAELEGLYYETNYVVHDSDIVIRIGEPSPAVDLLLADRGVSSWAFLTAWNPYSGQLSDEENARRQRQLFDKLNARGLSFLQGAGVDPKGDWPAEESVLVLGVDLDNAIELARSCEQNAIVFGHWGEPAQLVWCN